MRVFHPRANSFVLALVAALRACACVCVCPGGLLYSVVGFFLQATPALLAASVRAGFFAFGSALEEWPSRPLPPLRQRGLLNLELAGPEPPGVCVFAP